MNQAIERALEPPMPGRVVRAFAPIFSGIRTTQQHIVEYGGYWRDRAHDALTDQDLPTMVVLGDSLSQGIGASSPARSWPHRLALREAELDGNTAMSIVNLSRSGARMSDVVDIQLAALRSLDGPPRIVTCTVGSNDLVRGSTPGRSAASLRSLMAELPSQAILATLPANGSLMAKRLNRIIRAEAADNGLIVADVDRKLTTWRGRSAGDRFHPNDLGYEAWYDAFSEAASNLSPDPATAAHQNGEQRPGLSSR